MISIPLPYITWVGEKSLLFRKGERILESGCDSAEARKQSQEPVGVTTVYEDLNVCKEGKIAWGEGEAGTNSEGV